MGLTWREGWEPFDPLRPCWTCGKEPTHWFDRAKSEPAYGCHHDPVYLDDPPTPRWADRATKGEWEEAFRRAKRMMVENEERGWKSKYVPRGKTELEMKARGVAAELVAARLTGLRHHKAYLSTSYRRSRKKADIGDNVEVRNTSDHDGDLMLYENDPYERIALLVTGEDPFVLRGWLLVEDGKRRDLYRKTPEPARWVVPQEMLHPMPLPPDS
jgi:hypothetical protein